MRPTPEIARAVLERHEKWKQQRYNVLLTFWANLLMPLPKSTARVWGFWFRW